MRDTNAPPPFASVVLAGGRSRRFGDRNKALAVVDGRTFVGRAVVTVADAGSVSTVVAVETDDQRATVAGALGDDADPDFAFDAAGFEGPLSGLYGALPATDAEWLFVTACDMPRLSARAVRWLATRLGTDDASTRPDAVVPAHPDGNVEPLHGFYRRAAVAEARDRLDPESGVHALLDAVDAATVPMADAPPDVPLAASVENVNTRREYRRLKRSVAAATDR
jgi:molybdopterin-guanine dinucleotide biosynthesis protein A